MEDADLDGVLGKGGEPDSPNVSAASAESARPANRRLATAPSGVCMAMSLC